MSRTIRWALALLTALFMIAAALSVTTTSSTAATGDLPDGWTWDDIRDQCGTANDAYFIPWQPDKSYETIVNGKWMNDFEWITLEPGTSVITIEWRDDAYNLMGGPWTITYTDAVCTEPLANTYAVHLQGCNPDTGRTRVEVEMVNTAEGNPKEIVDPVVEADRAADGTSVPGDMWPSVPDGQTGYAYPGVEYGGLLPGTQRLRVLTDGDYVHPVFETQFFIPACGDEEVPYGDPVLDKPTPTAQLTKLSHRRMKVTLNNSKLDHATTFRLIVNPKQGKTKRTKVSVPAGMTVSTTCGMSGGLKRIRRTCNTRHGTVYTVKAQVGSHWKRLARKRL
jgi:hypothetical protein